MPAMPPPNITSSSSSYETRTPATLPLGDINLVVLTDVHSWVAGHGDNEGPNHLDVNYGDVVSFYEQIQQTCNNIAAYNCGDVWLVQNGDWIDGTGLSMDGDAKNLIEVLKQIPFDVLNTGNHDLYQSQVIQETQIEGGYLDWWGPRHLASNVYMNHSSSTSGSDVSKQPMSNRYHVLKGRNSTVLVFGFLYNMENPSDLVVVQTVEEAVQEAWFQSVLQDTSIGYNAILVLLHAGMDDPSVEILRAAIRDFTQDSPNLPIQFVAGHTHLRRHTMVDAQSKVVEAGRFLDTVGWISFPNADTIRETKQEREGHRRELQSESMQPVNTTSTTTTNIERTAATDLFQHVFLDANRKTLREALGIPSPQTVDYAGNDDEFQTQLGLEVASFIQKTRDSMGLTQHIGCAPMDYLLNQSLEHEDSLWGLFRDQVGVHALATVQVDAPSKNNRAMFLSQDSWRYGLYGGNHLTLDDLYAVSPFDEPIYRVSVLPCNAIHKLDRRMNADLSNVYLTQVPEWILSEYDDSQSANGNCELYVNRFGLDRVQAGLHELKQANGEPDVEWNPIESNLTTTNVWIQFVQDQWQCPNNDDNNMLLDWGSFQKSLESDNPPVGILVVAGALLLIALLLACFCCHCYRKRKRTNGNDGYDGVMVDSSAAVPGDNYLDDEGGDYCDDDDENEPPIRIV